MQSDDPRCLEEFFIHSGSKELRWLGRRSACRIIDSSVQSDRREPEREHTRIPDHRDRTETRGHTYVTYGHICRSFEIRKGFLS
ncbi:hypothetical protein ROHU_016337 [Labeo rohita]|uniref:Uncharacterized protein n=1 Tax=Labeo rohita TaxID=84645 RepID=A0A498NKF3_LABRO|nr:hypothetical protein ROHU_016337 [Labeo rohita]